MPDLFPEINNVLNEHYVFGKEVVYCKENCVFFLKNMAYALAGLLNTVLKEHSATPP